MSVKEVVMAIQDIAVEEQLELKDDEALLGIWDHAAKLEAECWALRERAEYEVRQRLKQRDATELSAGRWVAHLEPPTPVYDMGAMQALKELVSPGDWARAWIPESVKVIPGKLNMVKAKVWLRRGQEVKAVFDAARLPSGPGKLTIREKEPNDGHQPVGSG